MIPNENLLQIREYTEKGYRPVIDYETWRVAILCYHPGSEADAINSVQRHDETDEVFVLLSGNCILFLGDGDENVNTLYAMNMEPMKVYNVRRGTWHSHTLTKDAMVLIVENKDTTAANSPSQALTPEQCATIMEQTSTIWGT